MRRIVFGLVCATVALGAAAGVAVWRTPPGAIEAGLREGLTARGGVALEVRGATEFSLFPKLRLRLEDVRVSGPDGRPIAVARAVVATPRLGRLLMGRVELDEVTLKAPVVAAEALDLAGVAAVLKTRAASGVRPPKIRISDGVVTWPGGRLDELDAGLAWPRAGRPMAATGTATFRGRKLEGTASIADPLALAGDGRSGARLRLTAEGVRLAFEGAAIGGAAPRLEGGLGVRLSSLRDVVGWLGSAAPALSAPLARVSLSGRANVDRDGVSVSGAELVVDGAALVGAARFATRDGRPSIEATLDAETLDVTHYIDGFGALFASGGGWSETPLDARPFRAVDLDLRLSANAVTAGVFRLGPTAATISVADGAFDVALGEADAYGGSIRGHATIRPDGRNVGVKAGFTLAGVDSGDAMKALSAEVLLSGAFDGEIAVEGRGGSIAEVVASLDGRVAATLKSDRAIGGFRAKALSLFGLPGRFDVTEAQGAAVIAGGVARTEDLKVAGPLASLALVGDADLRARRLALAGQLAPFDGAALRAPVRIEGAFSDPKLRLGPAQPERRASVPD